MLKVINSDYQYVMTSCKYFKVQIISKSLFDRTLSKYLRKDEIRSIYLNRIIPILPYFESQWMKDRPSSDTVHKELVKTVAFLPKDTRSVSLLGKSKESFDSNPLFEKLEFATLRKEIQKYKIENFDMYQIKLKFYFVKSEFIPVNIVEIQHLRKITTAEMQIENLMMMKS